MAKATREVLPEFSKKQMLDLLDAFDSKSEKLQEDEIDQEGSSTEGNGGERGAESREDGKKDGGEDHDGDNEDDDNMLVNDLRFNQKVLWDLSALLEPAEGLQHVTIDGLDFVLLIREGIVFHATKDGYGYRGYKALLLNDVGIYLWHVTETMDKDIVERMLPSSRDEETGRRAAVWLDDLGKAKNFFKLDVLVPSMTCTSLVKIAECDGSDRRRFKCNYQFTGRRLPETAFCHMVQVLRELYDCTDAEKDTIRLYDFRTESGTEASSPKSTPVFKESDILDWPLGRFADVEHFSDWSTIKKDIKGRRKRRLSASNEGECGQPKRIKREELPQKEPELKKLVSRFMKPAGQYLLLQI